MKQTIEVLRRMHELWLALNNHSYSLCRSHQRDVGILYSEIEGVVINDNIKLSTKSAEPTEWERDVASFQLTTAIRMYRSRRNCSLVEAKEALEKCST